jgi:hypothetical protein
MNKQSNKNDNHQNNSQVDVAKKPKNLLNLYNLGLEDEAWQRIVKALAARGYPVKDEDLQRGKQ